MKLINQYINFHSPYHKNIFIQ